MKKINLFLILTALFVAVPFSHAAQTPQQVRTASKIVDVTPTLDTNAYANGDRLGSLMTISSPIRITGDGAVLQDIVLIDKAKQNVAIDIWFFDSSPTIASADNAAFDVSDANIGKALGVVSIAAADYKSTASNGVATVRNVGTLLRPTSGTTLYAIMVAGGAATYGASDITLRFKFLQD